jgi:predicted metal-dependent peptidase
MTMSVAAEKIERCSARMVLAYPWWASLFLNLVRIETDSVSTMAVDGTHLFFNAAFTESLSDKECLGVLLHETAHCALLHCYRMKYREPRRWNIACDKAVNAILVAANIALPIGCVPPGPLGSLAEELYEQITPAEMALYRRDVLQPDDYKDAADNARPMAEKDWRDAIAASHGLMPDYVARTIEEATASVKDWKNELARFIHSTRKSDTRTWTRQSRRVPGLSGWSREIETTIAICIDTSGSIVGDTMNAFVAECRAILDLSGVTAVVISADAAVSHVIQPGEPFPVALKGGGGTNFVPALNEAAKYQPDGIVYLTDGDGAYPPSCQYPVLWALTKPHAVPFGEKILIEGAFNANSTS